VVRPYVLLCTLLSDHVGTEYILDVVNFVVCHVCECCGVTMFVHIFRSQTGYESCSINC
jgi:hypothetical protein